MPEQRLSRYTLAFRLAAVVAMSIAVYHYIAFFYPDIGKVAYGAAHNPGYPARRHLFWTVTFTSLTGLLLRRPRWLIWPYLILVVEQLNGHGRGIWIHWVRDGFISRGDVGALVSELLILWLLILDWRTRRTRTG